MKGGYNLTQELVWGLRDSWHIVVNGPCYALWKGDTFVGNMDRTQEALGQKIDYVYKYHINRGNI